MQFSNVLAIIGHIGLLLHTEKDIESIVNNVFKTHSEKFPSGQELLGVLDDALSIIASGIFSLPDDVTQKIVQVLNGIKGQIPQASAA